MGTFSHPPLSIAYRNYRGEYRTREFYPMASVYMATRHHKEPQWILTGFDVEKEAIRDFAFNDLCGLNIAREYEAVTAIIADRWEPQDWKDPAKVESLIAEAKRLWKDDHPGQELFELRDFVTYLVRVAMRAGAEGGVKS